MAGIRANEDLHVATRSGQHQSAVDGLRSDRDGNHAEPLGNHAVGGHLAAGEEFGLDNRLAGVDLLPRAAAVEVFLADHRPGRNSILGPLFEFDVVVVERAMPVAMSALAT